MKRCMTLIALGALWVGIAAAQAADPASAQFTKKGYVTCASAPAPAEGTLECWFKASSSNNNEWILGYAKDKDSAMCLGFGPATLMYMVKTDGEWCYTTVMKDQVALDTWHHLACTFSGDRGKLYLDGVPARVVSPGNYGLNHLQGGVLTIGAGNMTQERFNGSIAEIRFSDVIRYKEAFTPPTAPFAPDANTVALWRFNETEGDVVKDASGKGHDGKIVGTVVRSADSPFAKAKPPEAAK